jgi:hypothetical protein
MTLERFPNNTHKLNFIASLMIWILLLGYSDLGLFHVLILATYLEAKNGCDSGAFSPLSQWNVQRVQHKA